MKKILLVSVLAASMAASGAFAAAGDGLLAAGTFSALYQLQTTLDKDLTSAKNTLDEDLTSARNSAGGSASDTPTLTVSMAIDGTKVSNSHDLTNLLTKLAKRSGEKVSIKPQKPSRNGPPGILVSLVKLSNSNYATYCAAPTQDSEGNNLPYTKIGKAGNTVTITCGSVKTNVEAAAQAMSEVQ